MINMDFLINSIYERIHTSKSKLYSNYIIVGNNMSGKSQLIKSLIEKYIQEDPKSIYFIDSCNRTIAKDNPRGMFSEITSITEITTDRLKPNNFNKVDKISPTYDNHLILNELFSNEEVYKNIIENYFKQSFKLDVSLISVIQDFLSPFSNFEYKIGATTYANLSNGYQAIIRLLVEIQYAVSQGVKIILIDEVVIYLDANNSRKFIDFLQNTFPDIHWIFTTHSPEVICASKNFNIIKLCENNYEIYDGNNFTDLELTIQSLFDQDIIEEDELENELGNLVRLKSMGEPLPKESLERIKSATTLNSVQKMYRDYLLNGLLGEENEN